MFARKATIGVMLCAVAALLGPAAGAGEVTVEKVDTPKVLTDKYVDTTSLEGIVNGIVKEGMSDQEKLIAFYHWYRRLIFHHRYMGGDRRNVLNTINSYGNNLCGSQAGALVVILKKAGFETRVVCGEGGKGFGGHTFVEVKCDGKWHCIDTMTNFFVFNRENPPQIASLDEMKKDPTLVTKAVEEKRAPPGFITCMNDPEITVKDIPRLEGELGMKADRRWATLTFEGGSLLEFWAKAPKKWRTLTTGNYGGHYIPGILDIVLKPNEEYVRLWDNVGKWIAGPSYACHGPHHTCGHTDEDDTLNFPFFEPYKKTNFGLTKTCYRYYGNGWLDWRPDAVAGEVEAGCDKVDNLVREGSTFKIKEAGKDGVMEISVKSPYAITDVELELEADGANPPLVSMGTTDRKKRTRFGPMPHPQKVKGVLRYATEQENPLYEYKLQIKAQGDTAFRVVGLKTTFQLNIYALPGFFPGKNTVTVSAKAPVKLDRKRLFVTYEWDEGPGWTTPRTLTKQIAEFPASYDVDVKGPKMPRMKRIVMKLAEKGIEKPKKTPAKKARPAGAPAAETSRDRREKPRRPQTGTVPWEPIHTPRSFART